MRRRIVIRNRFVRDTVHHLDGEQWARYTALMKRYEGNGAPLATWEMDELRKLQERLDRPEWKINPNTVSTRQPYWAGMKKRMGDGVGTREEVAYGEGYQEARGGTRRSNNPYQDQPLRAEWDRGWVASNIKYRVNSSARRGEYPIGAGSKMTRRIDAADAYQVVLHDGDYVDTVKFKSRSEAEAYARKWRQSDPANSAIVETAETDDARDFKSERGHQAKIFSQNGNVVGTSPVFIDQHDAESWLTQNIEKAKRLGYYVTGKVFAGFFDPALVRA